MDFFDALRKRFSVRSYQDKPVDDAALTTILEAVNGAPSAFNAQAFEVVVVRDAARKEQLAKICFNQMFAATAPVMLVFFANPDRNREKVGDDGAAVYSHEDATIACDYAHLAAAALGLGLREMPVKLIYKDATRHFGGMLDDPTALLHHYLQVLTAELRAVREPVEALCACD